MDSAEPDGDDTQNEQQPPILLTTSTNLMQLQKEIKGLVKDILEFRSTRNGTRVVTPDMADYYSIRTQFDKNKLSYFTFHPKGNKPIKFLIRHLPTDTPAEGICNGLQDLGFNVLSVKQMTAFRSSEGNNRQVNLPHSSLTLARNQKSQEMLRLINLCHIIIRVEAYRAQKALTQCYNCQDLRHV